MYEILTITVGCGFDAAGKPLDNVKARLSSAIEYLSGEFGGATAYPTSGGWLDNGDLILESGYRFEILIHRLDDPVDYEKVAETIRRMFSQQSVMYTVVSPTVSGFVESKEG